MLEEKYSFKEIEDKYNILWESSKVYKWNGEKDNAFTIDTPPPTISGKLHIGHIFSYCHTDFIARFQRMLGKDVFYPIGFDDNGLPTERLVEQTYKTRAKEVGREKFIEMCHEVIEKSKQEFKELFKSVGISYDWSLEYHTISKETVTLSQMSFIDLYNKGYAYRKMQPILWDPVDKTAIAQAEIEDKVFESSLNTIVFSTEENEQIHIATTRPELLPACVAVFCHPEDARYTHLVGKTATVAMTGAEVPIIADDKVKIDKGTGLVMCCTFGDELDIYWQQKHNLPMKIIIDQDGRVNLHDVHPGVIPVLDTGIQEKKTVSATEMTKEDICNQRREEWIPVSGHWDDTIGSTGMTSIVLNEINGLKVKEARRRIIEILTERGLLIESTSISHSVKCAERSGAPLEILPTYQWFIKILDQKAQVLDKVKECNWHPSNMRKRMEVWIEGLSWDWCISRQRYFGVPFPVWYSKRRGEEGKIILPKAKNLPIDPLKDLPEGYSKEEVTPDQDVMDTWATSAITPQLNALAVNSEFHLPNHRYDTIFPADLRSQSHEIIRTWAFYTILKAHYHANSLPWKNIMISGWCLADDKKKMSKSKGNIITPNVMLDTYGADVVRYWAANSRLGVDTVYSENIFKIGKRLVTKLWNASKFVSMFTEKHQAIGINSVSETMDKWILSKLYKVIEGATNNLLQFEYCEALETIEEFFWKDFCDNYLELVKKRAYGDGINSEANSSAKQSLVYVLNIILRLLAPFLPYITEEIYHQLYSYNSVHNQGNWPNKEELIYDKHSEGMGDNFVQILNIVRKIKADNNVSVKHLIKKLAIKATTQEDKLNQSAQNDLQTVCNAEVVEWSDSVQAGLATENGRFIVDAEL
ncbi:MAG: valine--tRNA ligase [Wolbachia sp.]